MKKGFLIILTGVGMLMVMGLVLFSNFNAQHFRVDVGHSFAELVRTNALSHNINVYIQESSEIAHDTTIEEIGLRGGYSLINSFSCDSIRSVERRYTVWNSNSCFPDKGKLEDNYKDTYLSAFYDIMDGFPTIKGTDLRQGYLSNKVFMDAAIEFTTNSDEETTSPTKISIVGAPTYMIDYDVDYDELTDTIEVTENPRSDFLEMESQGIFKFAIYPHFLIEKEAGFIDDFIKVINWAESNGADCTTDEGSDDDKVTGGTCTVNPPFQTILNKIPYGEQDYLLFDTQTNYGTLAFSIKLS
jgi:hypothetical protein